MDKVKDLERSLINLYINDVNVSGIFISGSLANNTYDQFSDVDIRFLLDSSDINKGSRLEQRQ